MICRICISVALLLGLAFVPACARDDVAAKDIKTKAAAKPKPYNEKADAQADLQAALKRAKSDNKRVLIQWGGNWCSWCVLLHERFTTDAELRRKLLYEYEYLPIDVGHNDKNKDIVERCQATLSKGVPYLTVLDSDGKAIANQPTDPFETKSEDGKNGHDSKKLLAFLTEHQAKALVAEELLHAALDKAAQTDRQVFVHYGAPWCGWCRRLDAWLARPEIAKTIGKEFVELKIDIERMDGGKAALTRYNPEAKGGIPWFAFLDSKGKALTTSDGPKGNTGFPSTEEEIGHFLKMLDTTKRHLTKEDLDQLQASLKAESKTTAH
ncbi:MAG TPA: thioredoxin family protein [Gemmataceae bacterium]|nr:thioredoxin family protein [Gemmataceae bacterium]